MLPNTKLIIRLVRVNEASIESGEDRTAIELFIAGVRGWAGHVRRQLDDDKAKSD